MNKYIEVTLGPKPPSDVIPFEISRKVGKIAASYGGCHVAFSPNRVGDYAVILKPKDGITPRQSRQLDRLVRFFERRDYPIDVRGRFYQIQQDSNIGTFSEKDLDAVQEVAGKYGITLRLDRSDIGELQVDVPLGLSAEDHSRITLEFERELRDRGYRPINNSLDYERKRLLEDAFAQPSQQPWNVVVQENNERFRQPA